ncbi:MAG: M20 family metallopeptidase [Erysipelotrichaceae bacterium]|nr:M20 family metallopeptidase [Erysipelotrichaceae bacterium]
MLNKILNDIECSKESLIEGLEELIRLKSSDGKATEAQKWVENKLNLLGFEVSSFKGVDEKCLKLDDYCPLDQPFHEDAYNVAGVHHSETSHPSLLLFGHIDTESEDYFGKTDFPYEAFHQDGKIFGLGASDDKGGIAMMMYALEFVQKHIGKLPYNCTVLSILGKHGGAAGTLSALVKGYRGDLGLYLHPAETGHGFAEIKNISLGAVDLNITVTGKPGKKHDDLDTGINANLLLAKVALWLEDYQQKMRNLYRFSFGSFQNEPSYILNIGSMNSSSGYGGIAQTASMKVRIRFFYPLTLNEVVEDITNMLHQHILAEQNMTLDQLHIEKGPLRASPAMVDTDHSFVQMVQQNITEVTGITDFIHQYHGGSDIRLPILYGNCQCIGIGPSCHLPEANSKEKEWISVDDYINGIKILARILYEFAEYTQ